MMEDFFGINYTMEQIREETGAQNFCEEVPMVQYSYWIVRHSRN
jgi:hypothetical protein